jgi:hypothetical protein
MVQRTFQLQQNGLNVKGTYVHVGAGLRRPAHACTQKTFLCRSSNALSDEERRTQKPTIAKPRFGNFPKVAIVESQNCCAHVSNLHFNELLCSPSKTTAKLSAPPFAAPRHALAAHSRGKPQRCTAPKHERHLNSAPNEAATSIWLKAMMVRSGLRGNAEVGK